MITPAPAGLQALFKRRLSSGRHQRPGMSMFAALGAALCADMEAFFGTTLSHVRIHVEADEATALGVQAFTLGSDIYFAPGAFDPFNHDGLKVLGHELTHVLQQQCGRALAPRGASSPSVLNDRALEAEADLIGECMADALNALNGRGAAMRVDLDGSFYPEHRPHGVGFDDFALFRRWAECNMANATGLIQRVIKMPKWWSAPDAAKVEKWVEAKKVAPPGMLALYHGTDLGFLNLVTGFTGTEQEWVSGFFQRKQGSTTHCGPGIYGGDSLAVARGYNVNVMVATNVELAKSRLVEVVGTGVYKQEKGSTLPKISAQQLYNYGYNCIVHYTQNYYAVKDSRVKWVVQA